MPTRAVAAATMEIGKKGKGKHWTESEVAARQEAADELKRKDAAKLKPPTWLGSEAVKVWNRKLKEVAGLNAAEELLDVLDSEMMAMYCDAYVQYQRTARIRQKTYDDVKELQAWARIISAYADKLGFTPSARARLVKKKATEKEKDKMSRFD